MLTAYFQSSWSHIIDLLPHNIKGRQARIRTWISHGLTERTYPILVLLVVQMVFNKGHHLRVRYSDTHSPLLSKCISLCVLEILSLFVYYAIGISPIDIEIT